jgi:hypothetical protein
MTQHHDVLRKAGFTHREIAALEQWIAHHLFLHEVECHPDAHEDSPAVLARAEEDEAHEQK